MTKQISYSQRFVMKHIASPSRTIERAVVARRSLVNWTKSPGSAPPGARSSSNTLGRLRRSRLQEQAPQVKVDMSTGEIIEESK